MVSTRFNLQTTLRTIPLRAWALVALSALLQVSIFPIAGPVPAWRAAFAWLALVPFLLAILLPGKDGKPLSEAQAALLGYGCGVIWYLGNCYWIYQTMYLYGGLPKPVSFGILILFALYLGLYHALFALVVAVVRRCGLGVTGGLLVGPFAWVAVELARERITGFPWDLLGYSQVDNLWLTRLAPVGGVMAISFVLMTVNAGFAGWFFLGGKQRWMAAGCAAVVAVGLQMGMPVLPYKALQSPDQMAVMMQDNLEVGHMAKYAQPIAPAHELRVFSELSLDPTRESMLKRPTVVVWPEAPAHFMTYEPEFQAGISELARRLQAPAIVGALGVVFTKDAPRGYYEYDSAALFDADGNAQGRYDKIHLVPWGEYVPFKRFFAFAQKLTEGVGDMDPGTQRDVFATGGHRYGVFICYESIFGDEVREFAKNGAEVLVNISDDGWYGDTGAPWQHLNMTRMRAIENRRWLLLDTNTGITTAIDPQGRTTVEAPRHVRGAYAMGFAFVSGMTFYTRYGDWFGWVCLVISLLTIGYAVLPDGPAARGAGVRTPF